MYSVFLLGDEPIRIRNLRPALADFAPTDATEFDCVQTYITPNTKNDNAAQRKRAAKKRRKAKAGSA